MRSSSRGHRWVYSFSVIDGDECPRAACTVAIEQFAAISPDAKLWRRSCNTRASRPLLQFSPSATRARRR